MKILGYMVFEQIIDCTISVYTVKMILYYPTDFNLNTMSKVGKEQKNAYSP